MAGRRTQKSVFEREEDLKKAIRVSGFTGQEAIQIFVDWYGWHSLTIQSGTIFQVITNSMSQKDH